MTASLIAKSNGTQGALMVNGADAVVFDSTGITSGYGANSIVAGKLSGAQSGSAPIYGARAWCVFNGTTAGTNAPLAGGNVTNVTRNSAGSYTINLTTAMPDANFSVAANQSNVANAFTTAAPATTGTATVGVYQPGGAGQIDSNLISVVIFR